MSTTVGDSGPITVLYIGGFGRSGSTLLAYLLGEVTGFFPVGELKTIWRAGLVDDELCGCGEPFSRCTFWQSVGTIAFGGWEHVDAEEMIHLDALVCNDRALLPLLTRRKGYRAAFDRHDAVFVNLLGAIQSVSGCEVVVDSTKLPMDCLVRARSKRIDTRVIHLVRDSRGAAFSKAKAHVRNPAASKDAFMRAYSPRHTAVRWLYNGLFFQLQAVAGVRRVRVSYEDIVADPRAVVERVLSRLGFAVPDDRLEPLGTGRVELGSLHTLRGNPMRFQPGSKAVKLDAAWRRQMATVDMWSVTLLTWPLLVAYGYLGRSRDR